MPLHHNGLFTHTMLLWRVPDYFSPGKPAFLSTLYGQAFGARKGNDGIYYGEDNLVHTLDEMRPWWMVDLKRNCVVWAVLFINRISNSQGEYETKKM